jgi:hypothetical protein
MTKIEVPTTLAYEKRMVAVSDCHERPIRIIQFNSHLMPNKKVWIECVHCERQCRLKVVEELAANVLLSTPSAPQP